MAEKARHPVPRGLKLPGRRLWKAVSSSYDLRPDELVLLAMACETADTIAALDAAMVDQPLVVLGSMQQVREHPLLREARQQRGALARLLGRLKLPDLDVYGAGVDRSGVRSVEARKAASARWSKRGANG